MISKKSARYVTKMKVTVQPSKISKHEYRYFKKVLCIIKAFGEGKGSFEHSSGRALTLHATVKFFFAELCSGHHNMSLAS